MKIAGALSAAAILATTEAFSPIGLATAPSKSCIQAHIDTRHTILPQEIGIWSTTPPKGYVPPHTEHIDTRHTILPQELGVWSTTPPAGYVPPHTEHIDTRKKILDQESKGVWPTSPPPGWVCPKPEGCSGEDIRDAWVSYAPYHHDGKVGSVGYVGCPGGGDWCYGSNGPASSSTSVVASSNAKNVAAALAGLGSSTPASASAGSAAGPPKRYGIGSWKK